MDDIRLISIIFLIGYIMSLIGVYMRGKQAGRKEMLGELIDKKVISTDIYVKLLKSLGL